MLGMKTGEFAGRAKTSKVLLDLLEHVPGVSDPPHHLSSATTQHYTTLRNPAGRIASQAILFGRSGLPITLDTF